MGEPLLAELDLRRGWVVASWDLQHRTFASSPFVRDLIQENLAAWLERLQTEIRSGRYNPSVPIICEIPKAKGAIRPGALLTVEDATVYSALVDRAIPAIKQDLSWTKERIDYSYRLSAGFSKHPWLRTAFEGWKAFGDQSLRMIRAGALYVVLTDISAFYENIDISLLISELRRIGVGEQLVSQLSICLNRWAISHKGIPQGYSASDILAKLYLNAVDMRMADLGYNHRRYVDDIRVFCHTMAQARRALADLASILRERGLNLQTSKTDVFLAPDAEQIIEGVRPQLASIQHEYMLEILRAANRADPYVDLPTAESIQADSPDDAPLDVIKRAFAAYFVDSDDSRFDKTLFHYLLRRLGRQNDSFALDYCISILGRHPEETEYILRYMSETESYSNVEERLTNFLQSSDAVYAFQKFQIVKWRSAGPSPSAQFLNIVRQIAFDAAQPNYLRSECFKLLGIFGSHVDLERIEGAYASAENDVQRSIIIASLQRLERGRRNAFLARAEDDGFMCECAAKSVRSGTIARTI